MFSLTTMAYRIAEMYHHAFVKNRMNDFEEMLLHHTCCIVLYGGCILINNYVAGCVIMLLHDISDITAAMVKITAESEYYKYAAHCMALNLVAWIYYRVICFPIIIYQMHMNWTFVPEMQLYGNFLRWVVTIFLSCLVILHVYWIYLMISMVFHYLKTGQAEDV